MPGGSDGGAEQEQVASHEYPCASNDGNLPDELPLSDTEVVPIGPAEELPDELPLSQGSGGKTAHAEEVCVAPEPKQTQPSDVLQVENVDKAPFGSQQPVVQRSSLLRKRGRPNPLLQEALGEALAKASLQASASLEVVGDVGEAPIMAPTAETESTVWARKQRRKELVQEVRQGLERASKETAEPKGAFRPTELGRVTALAATIASLPGEEIDATTLNAARKLVGDAPLELASKKLQANALGLTVKAQDSLVPVLGAATVLLDKHGREVLESAMVSDRRIDKLLVYLDFSAYDETPLQVAMRREGLLVRGGPAEPPLDRMLPDRATATVAPRNLAEATLLASMSINKSGPQKVLQVMQEGGMLLSRRQDGGGPLPHSVRPLRLGAGDRRCHEGGVASGPRRVRGFWQVLASWQGGLHRPEQIQLHGRTGSHG